MEFERREQNADFPRVLHDPLMPTPKTLDFRPAWDIFHRGGDRWRDQKSIGY